MCECEHLLISMLPYNRNLKLIQIFSLLSSTSMGKHPLIRHEESGASCLMQDIQSFTGISNMDLMDLQQSHMQEA